MERDAKFTGIEFDKFAVFLESWKKILRLLASSGLSAIHTTGNRPKRYLVAISKRNILLG